MNRVHTRAALAAVALTLSVSPEARAEFYYVEMVDAFNVPAAARPVTGEAPLSGIRGELLGGADIDMYKIHVTGGLFTASTVNTRGTLPDSQLFLFDANARGVAANDDFRSNVPRSRIAFANLAPGDYYIAISGYDFDPVSAGGFIFPTLDFTAQYGPTGPGGGSPVSGWQPNVGNFGYSGTYQIDLIGVEPFALPPAGVPAPGGLALVASAIGFMGLRRLRRSA